MGERKYFLDWLRVGAFGALIFYHVGMLYVSWGYNLKAERIFPQLEYAMSLVNPWRLVLLFFISGVASRFQLAKLKPGGFAKDRLRRLLPVILLGMLVINPPQVYVEALAKGWFEGEYLAFWFGPYLGGGLAPMRMTPTWDHLWFLLYLLVYAMGLALIFALRGNRKTQRIGLGWLIATPAIWIVIGNVLVFQITPVTHALFDDWGNHLRWIGIFAAGVICAGQEHFWSALRQHRRRLALVTLVLAAIHIAGMVYDAGSRWDGPLYSLASGIYGWSVLLTLCGYAAAWLDRPSGALAYLNDAVLPIYVFHQPVTLVFAFWLLPLQLPLPIEVLLLVAVTAAGSVLGYEIFARRTRVLRFLFGLKPAPAKRDAAAAD